MLTVYETRQEAHCWFMPLDQANCPRQRGVLLTRLFPPFFEAFVACQIPCFSVCSSEFLPLYPPASQIS
eukprot:6173164-Pleurochrysis_carterae.AAC.1